MEQKNYDEVNEVVDENEQQEIVVTGKKKFDKKKIGIIVGSAVALGIGVVLAVKHHGSGSSVVEAVADAATNVVEF